MSDDRKKNMTWVLILIACIPIFILHNWLTTRAYRPSEGQRAEIKAAQNQREEASRLIKAYLAIDRPSPEELEKLLASEAVKRHGCWLIYHWMAMPFVQRDLGPEDVDLPEQLRMFELLEALAQRPGVFTMPYGSPGQALSGGLNYLLKFYDLFNDLESAQAVYLRLRPMAPEDDYLAMSRGEGAYRLLKLYARAGRLEEAEKMLDEMRELMPPAGNHFLLRAYMHLAVAWAAQDCPEQAAEYHSRLKAMKQDRHIALYRLEIIEALEAASRRAGRLDEAAELKAEAEELLTPEVRRLYELSRKNRQFI